MTDVLAYDPVKEPWTGSVNGESTCGVELPGVSVESAVQGVDFEDMRKDAFVFRVCELPP